VNRSTALILGGFVLLITAATAPLAWTASAQWETEYVYAVETDDSYCASVVHETPAVEGTDDFRVAYQDLSATGQEHVEWAIDDGRYVVENETDVAPEFQFTDDHTAAGEGCYAVNYDADTYALRTSTEGRLRAPLGVGRPFLVGGLIGVLGVASLLAGVALVLKTRLK
jgi:hypothetical protein